MNYYFNFFVMSFWKNIFCIIGVIVFDIVIYFFVFILSGIEDIVIVNGYFVIIMIFYELYDYEKRNIENLVNMYVEGIIGCLF